MEWKHMIASCNLDMPRGIVLSEAILPLLSVWRKNCRKYMHKQLHTMDYTTIPKCFIQKEISIYLIINEYEISCQGNMIIVIEYSQNFQHIDSWFLPETQLTNRTTQYRKGVLNIYKYLLLSTHVLLPAFLGLYD